VTVPAARTPARGLARVGWLVLGLAAVALGGIGVVVPVLPTTIFFIVAAGCFARSSPRLERWVLGLPTIGRMVQDHRAGLGMPRRAKVLAVSALVAAVALSAALADRWWLRAVVALAGLVGLAVILLRVPTRERVLGERGTEG
jgi:uncharacterized membrane protein YbaN (DUF454 family)